MTLGSESCKSTATLPLLHHTHHIIPRLVQPSNQSTCFHRKTSATTTSCPFWLDRPDSFFTFTSAACAFRKQRINVTIPFTTLSNYLTPFWTSLLRSTTYLGGISTSLFTFMFHGLSGTVSIDRALSRRLNIIHHTSISVSVLDLLVLRWIRRVGNIELSLGRGKQTSNPSGANGNYVHWSLSVDGNGERDTMFIITTTINQCNTQWTTTHNHLVWIIKWIIMSWPLSLPWMKILTF